MIHHNWEGFSSGDRNIIEWEYKLNTIDNTGMFLALPKNPSLRARLPVWLRITPYTITPGKEPNQAFGPQHGGNIQKKGSYP